MDHSPPQPRGTALAVVYAALWVAGTVVPLSRFLPWLLANGVDVRRFLAELFATPIAAFFGWDVILTVVTLLVLMVVDRELSGRQRWGVAACALLVGASSGLPLYLLLRERRRHRGGE